MIYRIFAVIFVGLLMAACSTIRPVFEEPEVAITSFRVLPSSTINPQFEIGLHVVNPNAIALALRGLSYTATIEGHKILVGASNNLPEISAYGEGDVVIVASADLFNGMRLLSDLMRQPRDQFDYQLAIKLDVGAFLPAIRVVKDGLIQFSNP